jgi:uncharacterized protein (TIGR02246 family)
MSTTQHALDNEGLVREVINQWFNAAKAKDVDKLLSLYSDDAVVFAPMGNLKLNGRDEIRPVISEFLDKFDGNISANNQDLKIVAGDDTAFAYMITKISGKGRDGKPLDMTTRATVGFERRQGRWFATHEHASFPVDMPTGTARTDLQT